MIGVSAQGDGEDNGDNPVRRNPKFGTLHTILNRRRETLYACEKSMHSYNLINDTDYSSSTLLNARPLRHLQSLQCCKKPIERAADA